MFFSLLSKNETQFEAIHHDIDAHNEHLESSRR